MEGLQWDRHAADTQTRNTKAESWVQAEGQQLPGKKGISLQPLEWQQLRAGDGAAVQAPVEALQPKAAAPAGA